MNLTDQLKNKAGSDTQAYGESIMGVMLDLQNQGVNTGGSLSYLGDILNATLGATYNLDFNSVDAQNSLMDVINAAISTQQALVQTQIVAMQTAAIANDAAAYAAASAGVAQAQQRLAQLEALRTLALNSMSRAQKAYNSGLSQGTQNLHKNTAASKKNADQTKKTARTYKDWADDIKSVMDRADDLRWGVQRALADIDDATAKAVSTMLNEMYNLDGAYNRVFLQRVTQDNYLSMWYDMQDAARDAADAVTKAANDIMDAQAELLSISSDRASLQYGLQVAIDYGDALREQSIRAKLAELDAKEAAAARDLANAQHELADAQDAQNKSLTDNSQQAIKNRATVKDLLGTYSDYLSRLVDSGASAQDLTDAIAQSKLDFLAQGEALGFSASELGIYVSLFDRYMATSGSVTNDATKAVDDLDSSWEDYILSLISSGASQATINKAIQDGKTAVTNLATQMGLSKNETKKYADAFNGLSEIVKKIPKNVTIGINADKDAAINAINEFLKSKAVSDLRSLGGGVNIPIKVTADDNGVDKKIRKAMLMTQMADYLQLYAMYLGRGDRSRAGDAKRSYDAIKKKIASGNYYTGGYTGRGKKYEPAGIVHRGEYVVPKHEVNQSTGQPYFMERVQTQTTMQPTNMPTVFQVELSPTDRALLSNGGGVIELRLDGKLLTSVVNGHNRTNALRGSK